jgi:regulator of sigma E protease
MVEEPLQEGDRIIAIDGFPITQSLELFRYLQSRRVHFIVQRSSAPNKGWSTLTSSDADATFDRELPFEKVHTLALTIGNANADSSVAVQEGGGLRSLDSLVLLHPVEPTTLAALAKASGKESLLFSELAERRQEIEKISDPTRRALAFEQLEGGEQRLMLGLPLQDRKVRFNPSPFTQFFDVVADTGRTLHALIVGNLNPKWLSGPVGIVQVIHHGWQLGLTQALFWLAVISLNLAILNLLPIPVLDGGHITFALWEMITRRRMKAETMERLVIPFIVLLVLFFLFVTYQDILRLVRHLF